ncbi:hypothetical protein CNY89_29210, partial [Amaricoccus sp. HAR-UPW-R2A-40]
APPRLAEEAVQDTLVQIWRKAAQFRAGEGSALGWIFAILRNRCLNILAPPRLAEEAVQDTLVQIWRKAAQFRAGEGSALG